MIRKYTFLILTVILSILLTSCRSDINEALSGGKNADPEPAQISDPGSQASKNGIELLSGRKPIVEVRNDYLTDQEILRSSKYSNLRFDNCVFREMPVFDSVDLFSEGDASITAEESLGYIKEWLKMNDLTVDLDKDLRVVSSEYPRDETKEFPYFYPSVMEHYPNFSNGNNFFITNDTCHIQMVTRLIYSASNGIINSFVSPGSGRASLDAMGENFDWDNIIVSGPLSEHGTESYALLNGEQSVEDVSKTLISELTKTESIVGMDDRLSYDTDRVYICKTGDIYQLCFTVYRVYNGIPFSYGEMEIHMEDSEEQAQRGYSVHYDGGNMFTIDGHLDGFVVYGLPNSFVSECEPQTDIITVAQAADLLSDYLSNRVKLDVYRSSYLYCPIYSVDSEGWKTGHPTFHPCWMFDGKNSSDGKYMRCFVDSITGEIFYYVYGIEDHD